MFEGTLILNILAGFLSALFIFFSSIKIFGWQKQIFETQMQFMYKYGLNRVLYACIGIIEMTSAIMLMFQGTIFGALGALGIATTSLGAIFFHTRYDTFKDMVPAIITLTISVTILYLNQDLIMEFISLI